MLLEDMLLDVGCEVGEAVSRLEEALRAAQEGTFDFAILDVNLHGLPSYPVADILSARGVPFAFATGYGSDSLDPAYAAVPILLKPFTQADLTAVVSRLVSLGAVSRADDCGDVTKHRLE